MFIRTRPKPTSVRPELVEGLGKPQRTSQRQVQDILDLNFKDANTAPAPIFEIAQRTGVLL